MSGFWNSRRSIAFAWVSLGVWVAITVVGAVVVASGEILGLVVLLVGAVFTAVRVGVLWLYVRDRPSA